MKRVVISLLLLITILSLLVSCVPFPSPSACFTHIDLTGDGRCDFCGKETDTPKREYESFTTTERRKLVGLFGEVIPFMPCDEYLLSDYNDAEYGDVGVNYCVKGATRAEFDAYLARFSGYENDGTAKDDDGNTWYFFAKGDFYVDLAFYTVEGGTVMDLYAYTAPPPTGDDSDDQGGNQGGGNTDSGNQDATGHENTAFDPDESAELRAAYGFVIPFIPNDEYYLLTFAEAEIEGDGHNFYTYGNTEAEFRAYLDIFYDLYTFDYSEKDDYGDTWYYFTKGDYYIDVAYYESEDGWVVDVYVYPEEDGDSGSSGGNTGSGDQGGGNTGSGNQGGGNTGSGNQGGSDDGLVHFLNDGKGLPAGKDGIYSVDFTKATNVKDVTDQGYYLDGCPPIGSPTVLVVPVQFTDSLASSKGFSIDVLKSAFDGDSGSTDYYSVREYYYLSSYGQLDVDFTILDSWYTADNGSSYYKNLTDSEGYFNGDQILIDEILAYLEPKMDLSAFDSDGNDVIDAIVIINTLDIDYDVDMQWAYRYWNMYTDDDGYYYEYDGVSANDYLWASYQFLYEDEYGDFEDESAINTYTFIHEFAHVLGTDDYYNTSKNGATVLDGNDVMDSEAGDHNPYSKFNLGWITSSRLVTTDSSVTLTLSAFGDSGDTVIIANNWDDTLGAYQEYFVVIYYTETGLNAGMGGYFGESGIVVYHINSSLYMEEYDDGKIYYDVYNNNTDVSDEHGTENNLVELVANRGDYVYGVGDSLTSAYLDNGDALVYTFTVDSIVDGSATLTFSKPA